LLKNPKDSLRAITQMIENQEALRKKLEELERSNVKQLVSDVAASAVPVGDVYYIGVRLSMEPKLVKDLAFEVKAQVDDLFLVIAHDHEGKPGITVMLSESVVKAKGLHAGHLVRDLARHIDGGGGGQPYFATAGGKNLTGLDKALAESRKVLDASPNPE
jgi:alanyl-tRNA synthetase